MAHGSGTKPAEVVIVGGGFGGLTAAKALGDDPAVRVTVVDRSNHHLFQPLLYQVAMAGLSPAEIAAPIRSILSPHENVRVLMGEVTGFDLAERRVLLDGSGGSVTTSLPYDFLVVAVGVVTSYFGHDQWATAAPGLKCLEDAVEIRRRVLLAYERAEREPDAERRRELLTFVVIGGGPTGVELAGALSELSRYVLASDFRAVNPRETRVVLVEAGHRVLASLPEDLSAKAAKQLAELGVEVHTGARVTGIDDHGVTLQEGGQGSAPQSIRAATVLWGAGVRANPLLARLDAPLDKMGRVIVEKDCSIPGHDEVFVLGDAACFIHTGEGGAEGPPLPGLSPVAMQQARAVGRSILRTLHGEPREAFRYFDKGTMATIGRSRAVAQSGPFRMSGLLAWLAWLFVHVWYLIGFRNRVVVLLTWAWSYVTYKRGARLITGPAVPLLAPGPADPRG